MSSENNRLKLVRKYLNLSQKELAEGLGMQQGSLSDAERGKDGLGVSSNIKMQLKEKYRINIDYIENGNLPIQFGAANEESEAYRNLEKLAKTVIDNEEELIKVKIFDLWLTTKAQHRAITILQELAKGN